MGFPLHLLYAKLLLKSKPVQMFTDYSNLSFEPRCEKTGLRGFGPGPTQTGLYNHRRWLEA